MAKYPSLERKPGGPDNWVERVGGLPPYINLVAQHLHYVEGFTISHAIATAVNTVKRWAHKGTVVKYNDPKSNHVYTITAAKAAADVASWEAKKARAGASRGSRGRLSLSSVHRPEVLVDLQALALRANAIADPACRGTARSQILDLAMTKDGRKSFKHQGKWKHGFIPVDESATTSKAKGSPIAKRRIKRLYGSSTKASNASAAAEKRTLEARARKGETHGAQIRSNTGKQGARKGGPQERVQRAGLALHADIRNTQRTQRAKLSTKKEVGKGRRADPRASKPWDSIPQSEKTTRNGTRYVVTYFHGQRLLTTWIGQSGNVKAPGMEGRSYATVTTATLNQMSTADLRKLLRSGKNSKEVRAKIRKVMDAKLKKAAKTA